PANLFSSSESGLRASRRLQRRADFLTTGESYETAWSHRYVDRRFCLWRLGGRPVGQSGRQSPAGSSAWRCLGCSRSHGTFRWSFAPRERDQIVTGRFAEEAGALVAASRYPDLSQGG